MNAKIIKDQKIDFSKNLILDKVNFSYPNSKKNKWDIPKDGWHVDGDDDGRLDPYKSVTVYIPINVCLFSINCNSSFDNASNMSKYTIP